MEIALVTSPVQHTRRVPLTYPPFFWDDADADDHSELGVLL